MTDLATVRVLGTCFRLEVTRKDRSGNRTQRTYNPRSMSHAYKLAETFVKEADTTNIVILAELETWTKTGE